MATTGGWPFPSAHAMFGACVPSLFLSALILSCLPPIATSGWTALGIRRAPGGPNTRVPLPGGIVWPGELGWG